MDGLSVAKSVFYNKIPDTKFTITITDQTSKESTTDTLSFDTFKKMPDWILGFDYIRCNIEQILEKVHNVKLR